MPILIDAKQKKTSAFIKVITHKKFDKFRLVEFSIKSAFCGINPPAADEIASR